MFEVDDAVDFADIADILGLDSFQFWWIRKNPCWKTKEIMLKFCSLSMGIYHLIPKELQNDESFILGLDRYLKKSR